MKLDHSFTTTCLQKQCIAPLVYELRFRKPDAFVFTSGQFVLFDIPLLDNAADIQPRAYSIASTPSEQNLLFVIKLVQNGRASRWIEKALYPGTLVRMQGAFGNFKLDPAQGKQYLFIATGTGIAPIRSHILSALREMKDARPMHLLFGVLKREDLFWTEEWRRLEDEHANFHAHVSCLSGEADWHGETGSLQERLPRILQEIAVPSIYVCGAPVTVKELREQCLTLGIPKADVHFESYV